MSIRDEFLRLLREDEVFRYAVLGLLGITDAQASLRQLADALSKVLGVVGQLSEAETMHMSLTSQVLEAIKQLAEGQARLMEASLN